MHQDSMSKIEDKFKRLYEAHPRIDFGPYDTVFEVLKRISNPKKGVTITQLAEKVNFKRSKIDRIIRTLKEYKYVRTVGGGNRIPYLCIIDEDGDRDWKWGKHDIGQSINDNYNSTIKNLDKAKNLKKELIVEIKSYQTKEKNGKFFKIYNLVVEIIWSNAKNSSVNKMKMGSTAVRYCAGV